MKFYSLITGATLTIATTVNLQSATYASTEYDFIPKQGRQQADALQLSQSKSQAESVTNNQGGQTFFSHPPQLIRSASSQLGGYIPSTYEFTLTVPKDAGQALKAVSIAQDKSPELVKFDISSSRAFFGQRFAGGPEIRLASIGGEQPSKPGEATIVFDQPVQPGSTVTVALAVQRNPIWSGIYLFGVTVYPAGENGLSQFLGYGRISLYGNSG
ncbi:MAG: DUF2808 domain-containing protein [Plectolyngbya sp. WJT66-NPBG17]|nr:DUF2808 domain-containing protein [Plectolyngbya sp. WJT66-NPBG17]MBW4528622.1 DUF2808 domain-containing protein [Phormidium tanganyikae FI6-MK23]